MEFGKICFGKEFDKDEFAELSELLVTPDLGFPPPIAFNDLSAIFVAPLSFSPFATFPACPPVNVLAAFPTALPAVFSKP